MRYQTRGVLIGRSEERRLIGSALDTGVSVTIHGTVGVGKTALAKACLQERYGRDFDIIDGRADGAMVADAVNGSRRPVLVDDLRSVLENIDPDRRVLYTTQTATYAPEGLTVELGPLSSADAETLLVQRSGRPGTFAREVAERLDGLPQALCTAGDAALLTTYAAMLEDGDRLVARLGLADGYDEAIANVAPPARRLLRNLARFDSIGIPTARRLFSAGNIDAHLPTLIDNALVWEVSRDVDAVVLHVPRPIAARIRAKEKSSPAGWTNRLVEEAEHQARRYYCGDPIPSRRWLTRHQQDLERIATDAKTPPSRACRAALSLEPVVTTSGSMSNAVSLLHRAVDLAESADDEMLVLWAKWAQAKAWITRGCIEESAALVSAIEPTVSRTHDVPLVINVYALFANTLAWRGRVDDAMAYASQAAALAAADGLEYELALSRIQRCHVAILASRTADAISEARSLISDPHTAKFPRTYALAHAMLGRALLVEGRAEEAAGALHSASAALEAIGESAASIRVASLFASACHDAGRTDWAERSCRRSMALAERTGDDESATWSSLALAQLYKRSRRDQEAQKCLDEIAQSSWALASPALHARQRRLVQSLFVGSRGESVKRIVIDEDARYLEIDGDRVSLERRGPARRILRRLARALVEETNGPVQTFDLFDVGWPDANEGVDRASKVYTAVWILRGLGIGSAIVTAGDGYRLDSNAVAVRRTSG